MPVFTSIKYASVAQFTALFGRGVGRQSPGFGQIWATLVMGSWWVVHTKGIT